MTIVEALTVFRLPNMISLSDAFDEDMTHRQFFRVVPNDSRPNGLFLISVKDEQT